MLTASRTLLGEAVAAASARAIDHTSPIDDGSLYVPSTGRALPTSTLPSPSARKTAWDRHVAPSRAIVSATTLTLDAGTSPWRRILSGTSCKADAGAISICGAAATALLGARAAAPAPTRTLRRLTFTRTTLIGYRHRFSGCFSQYRMPRPA